MQTQILQMIESRNGAVSFAELAREIENFDGDKAFTTKNPNTVLWPQISEQAVRSLRKLIKADEIVGVPSNPLVYMIDGAIPNIPIAQRPFYPYKKPHWLPVVFWTAQQYKRLKEKPKRLPH